MRDPDPHTIHFHVLDPVLQILNYCALRIEEFALLCQRRPALLAAMHARAFAFPCEQQARKRAGRCAARIDCAVQVEPVRCQHVEIMVLAVVLAARQIDEEAPRVVVIARVDAKLREHGVVDEVRVPQERRLP